MNSRFFRAGLFVGFVALVVGGASCTSLPDIEPGTCGNGVVEPDHNEDCDNKVVDDAGRPVCYPAGTTAACHFDCSALDCPSGFSCGHDAVCRKPKGIYSEAGHGTQIAADHLFTGDFDHDGLGDVVAQTTVQMNVLFGDTSGGLSDPFAVRAPDSNPTVGLLALDPDAGTSEPYSDLTFSALNGITTWRGRQDRTLAPTPYPSLQIGNEEPRVVVARTTNPTDDVIVAAPLEEIFPDQTGSLFAELDSNDTPNFQRVFAIFSSSDETPAQIVGNIPVAQSIDGLPCDQIAIAFGAASVNDHVTVITTCTDPSTLNTFDPKAGALAAPIPPREIAMPAGVTVRAGGQGVHFGDVNGDGRPDLIVDAIQPVTALPDGGVAPTIKNFVAFNLGGGDYSPTFIDLLVDGSPILALGQLTTPTDNFIDIVIPTGIDLAVPNSPAPDAGADAGATANTTNPPFIVASQPWSAADIADIDGDGFADVIAGAAGRVDIYRGSGNAIEQLTAAHYAVDGAPSEFTVGDFDGDRVPDIAFKADHNDGTSDLDVMWGKIFAMPEDPVVVGRFGNIRSISTGVLAGDLGNNDSVSDLGVVVQPVPGADGVVSFTVSILDGSTDRQLQAPYFLQEQRSNQTRDIGLPLAFAVGQLTSDDRHLDLVTAAVVADPLGAGVTGGTGPAFDMQLAVLPAQGAANLGAPSFSDKFDSFSALDCKGPLCIAGGADWRKLSLVAVDLDGDNDGGVGNGVDEIVGLAPALSTGDLFHDKSADGALIWARFDGANWKIQSTKPFGSIPTTGTPISAIAVADLNGDGASDVLALVDGTPSTTLLAFMNQRNGQLSDKRTPISLPAYSKDAGFQIVGIAPIDADSAAGKEIAMLTDKGGVFLAKSNADGSSFDVTGPLCLSGPPSQCANNVKTGGLPSGNAIAAIDVDGDGVQDLVIESGSLLRVFKGVAVDP